MQLAYQERNARQNSNAPAVILLHGLLGRARNLAGLARALEGERRVLSLDLRNHGDSPHGPATYAAMAADIIDTIDALGVERASVMGHSMGGKTAMMLALTYPHRVEKLLVADMAPVAVPFGQHDLIHRLMALDLPPLPTRQAMRDFFTPIMGSTVMADWLGQNIKAGAPDPTHDPADWTIGLEALFTSYPTLQNWPDFPPQTQWNGPALFLRGENSPYVAPETWPAIRARFPQARIETIAEAGHWLHVDQPALFNQAACAFLLS